MDSASFKEIDGMIDNGSTDPEVVHIIENDEAEGSLKRDEVRRLMYKLRMRAVQRPDKAINAILEK